MPKFQVEYNIAHQSFEDFILVIYVLVDDLYKKIAHNQVKYRPNVDKALLSDSEIITFPRMSERSQFNRTRRNLLQVTNLIFTQLAKQFTDDIFIVDSFPLEVCKFGRAHFCKVFRSDGAAYGKNPSKKQTYFGFKVHAITTCAGALTAFKITTANVDDRKGLEDLSLERKADSIILGDKGYVSEPLAEKLKEQEQTLLALKRTNAREKYSPLLQEEIFRKRRRTLKPLFLN